MPRNKGDFNFSANFEVKKKATLDARQYVDNYTELFDFTADDYIPFGFPVTVGGFDDASKLGTWYCIDPNNLSNSLSWVRGNESLPYNQVIRIGTFDLNTTTNIAILDDWAFNENGINYEPAIKNDLQFTASDDEFTRADIVVWDSVNGYVVVQGLAAENYTIPNTPVGTILVQTVIRNVDGTVIPAEPNLDGVAKLNVSNLFTAKQIYKNSEFLEVWGSGGAGRSGLRSATSLGKFMGDTQFNAINNKYIISRPFNHTGTFEYDVDNPSTDRLMDIDLITKKTRFFNTVEALNPVNPQDLVTKSYGDANYLATQRTEYDYIIYKDETNTYARSGRGLADITNTDSYTVIQNAINTLSNNAGGKIHITKGTYNLTNELIINGWDSLNPPLGRLVIEGEGYTTHLVQNTDSKAGIIVKNKASITLQNFRISAGVNAFEALYLSDAGANSEVSVFGGLIDNLLITSNSTTRAGFRMQNTFDVSLPTLSVYNPQNDAVLIESTSTATIYGNSHFGFLRTYASTSHSGLRIEGYNSYKPVDMVTFSNYECISALYGIYAKGMSSCSFDFVDIEYIKYPIWFDGTVNERENLGNNILAGYVYPQGFEARGITMFGAASGGNNINIAIQTDGTSTALLLDQKQFRPANTYDILASFFSDPTNYSIVETDSTYLKIKHAFSNSNLIPNPASNSNSNQVATTSWTNNKLNTKSNLEGGNTFIDPQVINSGGPSTIALFAQGQINSYGTRFYFRDRAIVSSTLSDFVIRTAIEDSEFLHFFQGTGERDDLTWSKITGIFDFKFNPTFNGVNLITQTDINLQKGVVNGIAPLDSNVKIDPIYLPGLALNSIQTVTNQAARLALTNVQAGDAVKEIDTLSTYMLTIEPASNNANWIQIGDLSPDWSNIENKPTTIAGYNISDGVTLNYLQANYYDVSFVATNFQPKENQRLSTGNDVTFNSVSASYFTGPLFGNATSADTASTVTNGVYTTTFNGLGDARYSQLGHTHAFSEITAKPTTTVGYGITDAVTLTGAQTIAGIKTFTGSVFLNDRLIIVNALPATPNGSFTLLSRDNATGFINGENGSNLPISTATQTALNGKESILTFGTGLSRTGNTITNTVSQYTDSLARASLSFVAGSGAYNSTTGVITIPTNNNQIANGAGYLTSFIETDPTVPAYAKSLTSFSVIKNSTDILYSVLGHTHAYTEITGKPTNLSQFTNDLGNYGSWITQANGDTRYLQLTGGTLTGGLTGTTASFSGILSAISGQFAGNGSDDIINASRFGNARFVVKNGTNTVGINIATPTEALHVVGNGLFSGTVTAPTFIGSLQGNANTATNLSTNRNNWSSNGTINAVVGQLAWKNYGNAHTIFDASAGTAPDGSAINNTNSQNAWAPSFPTLMGWNGLNTYGVRVDSARVSDNSTAWGSTPANFGEFGNTVSWLVGGEGGIGKPFLAPAVRTFLGMPSGGDTLQSVMARGATTTFNLILDRSSTSTSSALRYSTNSVNDWFVGTNPLGTGSDYDIYNHNTATVNFRILKANGNTQIGYTSDQGYKLAVNGTGYFSGTITGSGLIAKGTGSSNVNNTIRFQRGSGTEMGYIGWSDENVNNSTWLFKSSNGNPIAFSADGTNQQFIISPSGNATFSGTVIGGVFQTNSQNSFFLNNAGNNDFTLTGAGNFRILNNSQTAALLTITNAGNATFSGQGYFSNNVTANNGITNVGDHSNTFIQTYLPASANGAGSGIVSLRMWCSEPGVSWDSAGFGYNVTNDGGANGFGRINPNFGQAYMRMDSNGFWRFYNLNPAVGTRHTTMSLTPDGNAIFSGTVTASSGFFNSDIRLKNILTDYKPDVSSIQAIGFNWKDKRDNLNHYGYSAQEVEILMPHAISTDNKGFKSVNYTEVLVAKVQALENEVAQLKARLN